MLRVRLEIDGVPHERVAAYLADEHGIGVRSGCFCAHPYLAHLLRLDSARLHEVRQRLTHDDRRDLPAALRQGHDDYGQQHLQRLAHGRRLAR